MVMSVIWTLLLLISLVCSAVTGSGAALASAVLQGAQAGVTLAISMTGAVCLWTGVSRLMESVGISDTLAKLLQPLLKRLFPTSGKDPSLARHLSANVCVTIKPLPSASEAEMENGVVVSGRVVDGQTGEPVVGAIIMETGSTKGIITDLKGEFRLKTEKDKELKFLMIDYETRTFQVNELGKSEEIRLTKTKK